MALPPTFSARVRGSVVLQDQRRISGSGIAEGLTLLGREGSAAQARREAAEREIAASEARIQEREIARDRLHSAAEVGAKFTGAQVSLAQRIGQLEREPKAGGAGHILEVQRALSEQRTALFSELPDDQELRDRFSGQWSEYEARQLIRADTFEAGQRVEKAGNDFKAMAGNSDTLIAADGSIDTWQAQSATEDAAIDAMPISENDKATLRAERGSKRAGALLEGMIGKGQWDAAEALRTNPEFRAILGADGVRTYKRLGDNARDTAAREAELAAGKQRDAVREDIDLIEAQIKAGATDIDIGRLRQVREAAKAAGLDKDELFKIDNWQIQGEVNRRYTSVGQLNSGIGQLRAQQAAGQLNANGQIQLAHMEDRRSTLLRERGEGLKDQWSQGGAGRAGAMHQLYQLPVADRIEVAATLDPSMRYAARASLGVASVIADGIEVRKADKTVLPSDAAASANRRKVFDGAVGQALSTFAPPDRMAVLDMAENYYAALASRRGAKDFDPVLFTAALNSVLGGDQGKGGIGRWKDNPVWLPDGVDAGMFDRALARSDFADALEPKATIAAKYVPVFVRDSQHGRIYQFRDATGASLGRKSKRGSPYELEVKP